MSGIRYTTIPSKWFRDSRLSYRARGLLAMILTYVPGEEISDEELEAGPDGKVAIHSAIEELETCGYLKMQRPRLDDGTLGPMQHVLSEPES